MTPERLWLWLQAMDLISVAQETGEVSAEAYTQAWNEAGGILPPPQLVGIEDQVTMNDTL